MMLRSALKAVALFVLLACSSVNVLAQIEDVPLLDVLKKPSPVVVIITPPDGGCLERCDNNCDACAERANGDPDALLLCEIDRDDCYPSCSLKPAGDDREKAVQQ